MQHPTIKILLERRPEAQLCGGNVYEHVDGKNVEYGYFEAGVFELTEAGKSVLYGETEEDVVVEAPKATRGRKAKVDVDALDLDNP